MEGISDLQISGSQGVIHSAKPTLTSRIPTVQPTKLALKSSKPDAATTSTTHVRTTKSSTKPLSKLSIPKSRVKFAKQESNLTAATKQQSADVVPSLGVMPRYPLRPITPSDGRLVPTGIDTSGTQYSIVDRAARTARFRDKCPTENAVIVWRDECLKPSDIAIMQETGLRWNHLPGIERICTKCGLQQTLGRMIDAFPKKFKYMPRSWSLPVQWIKLNHYMTTKGKKSGVTLIVKPNTMSRGRGIYLTRETPERTPDNVVVQLYLERPLTINSFKFDLRMYVLITDIRCQNGSLPRAFLHHEGLVRFCTTPYEQPSSDNLSNNCQHLSNYSVNKWASDFKKSDSTVVELEHLIQESDERGLLPIGGEYLFGGGANGTVGKGLQESSLAHEVRSRQEGSKWTITAFSQWALKNNHDVAKLWDKCTDLVAKTILAASVNGMSDEYCSHFGDEKLDLGLRCFELMGIDVMLDETLKPYLLEINMSPSAATDTALDLLVKETVHTEALKIANISLPSNHDDPTENIRLREEKEDALCHGFQRILPLPSPEDTPARATSYAEIASFKRQSLKAKAVKSTN